MKIQIFEEYWNTCPRYMDEVTNNHIKHEVEKAFRAGQISIIKSDLYTGDVRIDDYIIIPKE